MTSHTDQDLSVDRPELDDEKGTIKLQKEQRRRFEKDNRDRRIRDQDERETEHDNTRDFNLQRFPDKRRPPRKVEGYGLEDKDSLKSESIKLSSSVLKEVKCVLCAFF